MTLLALAAVMITASPEVREWDLLTSMTHVRSAQATADGLWCATSGGVFFYSFTDGFTVEYRYPADLPHFAVDDVLLDTQGRLWCATGDGLAMLQDGQWTVFTSFEGIPGSGGVTDVEQAGSWIWAGSDGGLARWDGTGFLQLDEDLTQGGFTASEVDALAGRDDSLWIATGLGVFSLDLDASPFSQESWRLWPGTQGLGIEGFLATPDSLYGFGTGGVFRRDAGAWTVLLDYSGSADSTVMDLALTPDGLLAACYGVRRRISGTDWEPWGAGFPPGTQATFLESGGGAVWCGEGSLHWTNTDYGRGLARLDSGVWTTLQIPGPPARSCYQPALVSGGFYSGSHNAGLMARRDDAWRTFGQEDGIPTTLRVYTAAEAPGGTLWTASYHYGLTWVDDGGTLDGSDDSLVTFVSDSIEVPPTVTQVLSPLLNNQVVCLLSGGTTLWIGHEPFWSTPGEPSGISVCVGDPAAGDLQWATFGVGDGLASGNVRSLCRHGADGLWIAFSGDAGCQYLDFAGTPLVHSDDTWLPAPGQAYGASFGLPSNQVFSFCDDAAGGVLIGTGAGLARWSPSAGFSVVEGVPGAIKALALDGDGVAWCLGTSGIFSVDGAAVTSYTESNSPFIPSGRVENEFAMWDAEAGRMMFSSAVGFWVLDTGAGSGGQGGPSFYPQPFLPGDGGVLHLASAGEGPVEVGLYSIDGGYVTSVDAASADAWSWDGTAGGGPVAGGLYLALIVSESGTTVSKLAVVR